MSGNDADGQFYEFDRLLVEAALAKAISKDDYLNWGNKRRFVSQKILFDSHHGNLLTNNRPAGIYHQCIHVETYSDGSVIYCVSGEGKSSFNRYSATLGGIESNLKDGNENNYFAQGVGI